ncbi:Flp pilus assembly protein, pilin Flp [Hoeflea sp. IMCC20628]|uniref:Flp family type IVb pilin n=1 Tax=Hoeflea sp. IMCC20628 TaxID=1620421 RepID=UPI00063AC30A|nr:Flp family type IVb pilin [Hoeflea sp. IMCC20628]AKI03269.1 Flp pilus assembly protein, pilin Flp [Hoeflea sp. IMCC20628]
MKIAFFQFVKDRCGATAIEYALIASLISGGLIAGGMKLGNTINSTMAGPAQHLKNSQGD